MTVNAIKDSSGYCTGSGIDWVPVPRLASGQLFGKLPLLLPALPCVKWIQGHLPYVLVQSVTLGKGLAQCLESGNSITFLFNYIKRKVQKQMSQEIGNVIFYPDLNHS